MEEWVGEDADAAVDVDVALTGPSFLDRERPFRELPCNENKRGNYIT